MASTKNIIKFETGKTYICKEIKYLCIETTEEEVTFKKIRRISRSGKIRYSYPITLKIIGKREACQKAVVFSWYVDGQKYRDFIFAE